jgi:NAD(P)-dependent dehydrogenase (short-subunit alcohol dehydrogenase family)
MADQEVAVVVGGGPGLSASLVRLFTREGMKAAIAARNPDKLEALSESTGCRAYRCDAVVPEEVNELFARVSQDLGAPNVVVYNASARVRGPLTEIDAGAVRDAIMVTCYGGFLVGQAAAVSMLRTGGGTILFTGASASVKGYANSASFAMGKFGLSGLTQSMAREFQPQNIHVAQIVIDGGIDSPRRDPGRGPDTWLSPDSIAETYLHLHRQHRSAWASHIELRPWVEKF